MARTAIALQSVGDNAGATYTFSAADSTNNMIVPNNGKLELLIKNGSGSSITVTVHSVACSHGRTSDLVLTVAAGAIVGVPKLDPALFNQSGSDIGNVYIDFSASASITVAAIGR